MEFDLMTGGGPWAEVAGRARGVEAAGFSGMLFTETGLTPWMSIATAAQAAPTLHFSTGVAVAFARSPMVSASIAWELAEGTKGKFRLGLGSQVRAHIERRYSAEFDPPGPRMRDHLLAVKACLRAFRGEERLSHEGPYYDLSLLPENWAPRKHEFGDIKVDVSAVGPWMTRMAGEVADGIHVHPFHSPTYIQDVLVPKVAEGAERAGRDPGEVDLIVPVFTVVGDTREEQEPLRQLARQQIAFYGSTRNYAFQFDMLGFEGTSAKLNDRLKAGDMAGMGALIDDEMLEHYAVTATWDELADKLLARYGGTAARVVMYLAEASLRREPTAIGRWGEVARAVRAG